MIELTRSAGRCLGISVCAVALVGCDMVDAPGAVNAGAWDLECAGGICQESSIMEACVKNGEGECVEPREEECDLHSKSSCVVEPIPCEKQGDGDCPPAFTPTMRLTGAGQRAIGAPDIIFTFGGEIEHDENADLIEGHFTVTTTPDAPTGDVLNVYCQFEDFSSWMPPDPDTLTFEGVGECRALFRDGHTELFATENIFSIVFDVGPMGEDAFDLDFIGPTGVAVPGGLLTDGDFELVTLPAS